MKPLRTAPAATPQPIAEKMESESGQREIGLEMKWHLVDLA